VNLYPVSSPYHTTNMNGNYLDVMNIREISKDPSDVYMELTLVYQYRPDLLAYDLYGDSRLWWVFAARNINRLGTDPYFDFVAGLSIYIPKLENIRLSLGI
jgi:hypothetical protein